MKTEKFTKEEIETAKKVWDTFKVNPGCSKSYNEYLDSLLKPERKKIRVEIEYDNIEYPIVAEDISDMIISQFNLRYNFKITELPEVFTREEVIKFAENYTVYCETSVKDYFNIYFSERKSK